MKVAIFSTQEIHGGAAKASQRLFQALKKDNVNAHYLVKDKKSNNVDVCQVSLESQSAALGQAVQSVYISPNRTEISNTYFSFSYTNAYITELIEKYDLINLHWIESFLSLKNLYEIVQTSKPIVWTLHDMKPFTGGCHYSAGCDQYVFGCEYCPQLREDPHYLPRTVLELKKNIFKDVNLTIVSPSKWLAKEAKKSQLFQNSEIIVIPNGIDSEKFRAHDKKSAKIYFGIDDQMCVVMFGVMNHNEKRKGYAELLQGLEQLICKYGSKNMIALFVGAPAAADFPIPAVSLGLIESEELMAMAYSAASMFILPSLEDNFPNTILEALSCETPVIAFDTGGVSDIVSETNGIIVPKGDIDALSDAIHTLVSDPKKALLLGRNGRNLVKEKYQYAHQSKAYRKLFEKLCKDTPFLPAKIIEYDDHKLDAILGYSLKQTPITKQKVGFFPDSIREFYIFFEKLGLSGEKFVIYGHGSVGKIVSNLMGQSVVGFVDQSSVLVTTQIDERGVYAVENLKVMAYDKIIISVLGREDEIERYLIDTIGIEQEKIIRCPFERF